jgi:uncharacterized protein YjbI with pentapeptide repeats
MTTVNNRKVSPPAGKDEDQREKGFFNRPRAGGKSIWDWMQLLIIPFVLTVGGLLFSTYQHNTDQQRALDQQQATILQTYIDNIQDLLLNHNLLKSKPDDDVAILARARTLTALQGLDPERKGHLLTFLYACRLIGFDDPNGKTHNSIIYLYSADLSYVYLSGANLSGANLSGAILYRADLDIALLYNANLSSADLSYADLSGIRSFSGANLSGAELRNANLSDAQNLTQHQLDQVYTCKGATLPPGLTCHRNQ